MPDCLTSTMSQLGAALCCLPSIKGRPRNGLTAKLPRRPISGSLLTHTNGPNLSVGDAAFISNLTRLANVYGAMWLVGATLPLVF